MDLKIPKREITVTIAMLDQAQDPQSYHIYLSQCSRRHTGEESLEEFLNGENTFIPIKHSENNDFIIAGVQHILYVEEQEPIDIDPLSTLKLEMVGGLTMKLEHFEPQPLFHSRPVDFFNTTQTFLTFCRNKRKIHINKAHILRVLEQ